MGIFFDTQHEPGRTIMLWKEIRAFVGFMLPFAIAVCAMIGAAFASLPLAWALKMWALYWFPVWGS